MKNPLPAINNSGRENPAAVVCDSIPIARHLRGGGAQEFCIAHGKLAPNGIVIDRIAEDVPVHRDAAGGISDAPPQNTVQAVNSGKFRSIGV